MVASIKFTNSHIRCFAGHWCSEQLGISCQPESKADSEIKEVNKVLTNSSKVEGCADSIEV